MPTLLFKSKLIHYRDTGIKNDFAVVFVHGNSCSTRTWDALYESALSNQYRLIALDLPGHGKSEYSSNPEQDYTIQGLADCVAFLIKSLNLSSFIMVGHSLGGHLVVESTNKVKNCVGIMIFGTPPARMPLPYDIFIGDPQVLAYNFTPTLTLEQAEALARSRAMSLLDVKPLVQDILKTDVSFRGTLAASIGGPLGITDEISIVETLTIPLAILHGGFHEIANIKYIENLKLPTLWKNKIHVVEGSGHTIPEENPSVFENLLTDFTNYCEQT